MIRAILLLVGDATRALFGNYGWKRTFRQRLQNCADVITEYRNNWQEIVDGGFGGCA